MAHTERMELTFWITPFTQLRSRDELQDRVQGLTPDGWHPNILLPTHYGAVLQGAVRQNLPADLLVSSIDDIAAIRDDIEQRGLGFGVWGVPMSQGDADLARTCALVGGFYVANTERGRDFSEALLIPGGMVQWWTAFWNEDANPLDGSVYATLVPNTDTLSLGKGILEELAGGANALALETYGGPNTPEYPFPSLWPTPSFEKVGALLPDSKLVPILAVENLAEQLAECDALSPGEVQVWAL